MSDRFHGGLTTTEIITMLVACAAVLLASYGLGKMADLAHRLEWVVAQLPPLRNRLDDAERDERERYYAGLSPETTDERIKHIERWIAERDGAVPAARPADYRLVEGVPALPTYDRAASRERTILAPAPPQGAGAWAPEARPGIDAAGGERPAGEAFREVQARIADLKAAQGHGATLASRVSPTGGAGS